MDKLGQLVYKNQDLLYKYKGVVETPSLGMVDDILSIQKCSNDTVKMNAIINSFVEGKKLKLSAIGYMYRTKRSKITQNVRI